MNCTDQLMKITLFIFNFILLLIGIGIICVAVRPSIIGEFDGIEELKAVTDTLKDIRFPTTELIIVGSFISLVSFYGCCGAATKSTFCLKLYTAFNLIIIGGLIVTTAICYYQYKDITKNDVEKFIADNFNNDKYNGSKTIINLVQSSQYCCGKTGKEDYGNTVNFPLSCCPRNYTEINTCYENAYKVSCISKVVEVLHEFNTDIDKVKKSLLYISLGSGITEIVTSIFAMSLAQSISNDRRRSFGA
ncbi:23 kDa integral membrane protein-like [Aphidius gifuensis]|uniref:23 kDa integral membrane protein-like n=1 Tax=Aphidius gifuensis TaxID=684658 RepID=UPI001CDBEC17|nr:23 kDa integral membrane protein-like [Aphidius gifuensis]